MLIFDSVGGEEHAYFFSISRKLWTVQYNYSLSWQLNISFSADVSILWTKKRLHNIIVIIIDILEKLNFSSINAFFARSKRSSTLFWSKTNYTKNRLVIVQRLSFLNLLFF